MDEPLTGRELGRRILAAIRSYVARSLGEVSARVDALQKAVEQTPSPEAMRAEMAADMEAALRSIRDELSASPPASMEAARSILEAEVAKWALDFERRAQMLLQSAIDRVPRPADGIDGKDGADGKDGKDGLNGLDGGTVEDFDIAVNERDLTVTMIIGGQPKSRTVRLDVPIERGVFQSGKKYGKSDMVTFSGSQFIATRDTTGTEVPEKSPAWRLIVKRGKDGKDAEGAQ